MILRTYVDILQAMNPRLPGELRHVGNLKDKVIFV